MPIRDVPWTQLRVGAACSRPPCPVRVASSGGVADLLSKCQPSLTLGETLGTFKGRVFQFTSTFSTYFDFGHQFFNFFDISFSVDDLRKLIEKAGGSMGNIYSQSASISSSLNRPPITTTEVSHT